MVAGLLQGPSLSLGGANGAKGRALSIQPLLLRLVLYSGMVCIGPGDRSVGVMTVRKGSHGLEQHPSPTSTCVVEVKSSKAGEGP